MGVQGLWSLLGPAARPTQLESLRQKRIAVDASIWIHQFMRTMRDKEGNALKNGHLLGFFRRLCKLLFYDIKPVFVFDGGAPALKRSTIRERRKRREGIKVNMRATAKKILSAQVKSRVLLEQERKLRGENEECYNDEDENYVYVEQLEKTAEVLRKNRKLDQYELPEVDANKTLNRLDPRLASVEEIQSFVDEFNVNELDIDSETFQSLPPEVQYEVIQDLKHKSRQTSWARLDEMVRGSKTALDFSKHQIKLLKHRNDMTQRMMQMNTVAGGESETAPTRVAGERGRQYVLYKNENLDEGLGWKLPGLSAEEPVIIDHPPNKPEPKLEVISKQELPSLEEEDKVKAAMAKNPELAALFSGFLSDEEDDIEEDELLMEEIPTGEEEEPLFQGYTDSINKNNKEIPSLMDDMGAYMEEDDSDAAINQVISKIYKENEDFISIGDSSQEKGMEESITSLTSGDFLELWKSRMPDAFLYLHSFNDEHKRLLENAVNEENVSVIENELRSVRKQFGKTNEGDELALESLQFHESFLESVIAWKHKNMEWKQSHIIIDDFEDENASEDAPKIHNNSAQSGQKLSPLFVEDSEGAGGTQLKTKPVEDTGENIVLTDDEDEDIQFLPTSLPGESKDEDIILSDDEDEDIQFLPVGSSNEVEDPKKITTEGGASHAVKIDIRQSRLNAGTTPIVKIGDKEKLSEDKYINLKSNGSAERDTTGRISDKEDDVEAQNSIAEVTILSTEETTDLEATSTTGDIGVNEINRGYNSEDETEDNTHGEEDEYARFVSDIASKHLDEVRKDLYQDMRGLNSQQRKDMGNSDDVTDQMVQDIQELLKLFGVPFIVSPMEAEAQCAELENLHLIDGTITDDSDVFLFGASRVYKNMFNQQRFVECYMSKDIEREMLLSRKTLIQLAFLLGSDYTDGIPGVGPVAAMEILSEFTSSEETNEEQERNEKEDEDDTVEGPLIKFKEWYNSGIDTTPFQRKFRKSHPDIDIPDDFPNPLVQAAYYHPLVDHSKQKFVWGQPQLDSLRIFLTEAFGWTEEKADQVLLPVLREMNNKKASGEQQVIGSFFDVSETVSSNTKNSNEHGQKHSSKRVRNIVEKWRNQKKAKSSK